MINKPTKTVYISVKDFSVTGEQFDLLYNEELELLETYPQPTLEKLPEYYASEDYISHTDSQRNLFEKVYQFVKGLALKRKLKLIESYSKNGKLLLDVGCGTGDFLQIAKNNGWSVSGIEPNKYARDIANKKTNNSVFKIEHLSNLKEQSFDIITLWHVLEHLPNLDEHIALFNRLLKPDGCLIIAVPNYKSYDALHYKEFWAAFDVPRHFWHFSKNAISKLVSNFHMNVIEVLPMKFDAYYVSLLSEKYKSGWMNPLKAFWIGWRSNQLARRTGAYSSLIYIIKKDKS